MPQLSSSAVTFLAVSGSLRAASLNSALLRATARIAPAGIRVRPCASLGHLPLFNPDLEERGLGAAPPVARLRADLIACDAVIIASPEYAHGVTGVLKNALDWMVGNESFVDKPVALFNCSPRAVHAQAALREILATMSARVITAASVTVPMLGTGLDERGIADDAKIRDSICGALLALRDAAMRRGGAT